MLQHRDKIIELLQQNKSYDEIVTELGCAKSTISFHAKKLGLNKVRTYSIRYCKKCNRALETYTVSRRLYCNDCHPTKHPTGQCKVCDRKILGTRTICKNCSVEIVRYNSLKKAVEYLGNKCSRCEQNFALAAYDFHHIDPKNKKYSIASLLARCANWELLKSEIDKCELLCANCHRLEDNTAQRRIENFLSHIPE